MDKIGQKIVGVDLGGTNVRAGKVVGDKIVNLSKQKISSQAESYVIVNELINIIEKVFDDEVEAIGIGVPSMVDVENGIVYDVQNIPSWREIHLRKILETKFEVPVFVNNDANCFVLGEKHFGKAQKYSNVVGLISGTGFGAGIIIHDKLYNGKNCGAGEFGMISYKDSIFEHYCSGQFFDKFYNLSGEDLTERAKKKDQEALSIFSEFGENIGNAINTILYANDPDIIILGGSVSNSFSYYKNAMYKSMGDFAFKQIVNNIKIEVSEIEHPALYGAAALYLNHLIDRKAK